MRGLRWWPHQGMKVRYQPHVHIIALVSLSLCCASVRSSDDGSRDGGMKPHFFYVQFFVGAYGSVLVCDERTCVTNNKVLLISFDFVCDFFRIIPIIISELFQLQGRRVLSGSKYIKRPMCIERWSFEQQLLYYVLCSHRFGIMNRAYVRKNFLDFVWRHSFERVVSQVKRSMRCCKVCT